MNNYVRPIMTMLFATVALFAWGNAARSAVQKDAESIGSYHLTLIKLSLGTNVIDDFTPDQKSGVVFVAWRGNGNAHGFTDYIFTVDGDVVGVQDDASKPLDDVIRGYPFDGEAIETSVYLLRGYIGRDSGVFLVIADRQFGTQFFTFADSVPVKISIFSLKTNTLSQFGSGSTDDAFEPLAELTTTTCYRSADVALFNNLKIYGADELAKEAQQAQGPAQPCTN